MCEAVGWAQSQHSIGGIETAFPSDECLLNIEKWNLESVGLEKDFRGIYQYILQRYSFRLRQGLTVSGLTCCQALVKLNLPNLIHQFYFMLKSCCLFVLDRQEPPLSCCFERSVMNHGKL